MLQVLPGKVLTNDWREFCLHLHELRAGHVCIDWLIFLRGHVPCWDVGQPRFFELRQLPRGNLLSSQRSELVDAVHAMPPRDVWQSGGVHLFHLVLSLRHPWRR